jgi:TPR repeat protein
MPDAKPAQNQENDVRLADRLATRHLHSHDSTPKSSELVNHPIDHNIAPSGNEKSTSRLSTSKPAQDLDIDARLAEQGDAFAQYRLGRYYAQRDGRQTPESISWYKKASPGLHRLAETGNGQAMYVLGVMYAYGRGVTRSTDEARRWLTRAVEHKITAAQPVLAKLAVHPHTNQNPKAAEQAKHLKLQN